MRLTWRGIALLLVVGSAFMLSQAHGARSLGVIVFSGAIALVAAFWQVTTATVPTLTREFLPEGTAGEHHTVRVSVGSTDTGQLGVRDHLSAGFRASPTGMAESNTNNSEQGPATRGGRWQFLFRLVDALGADLAVGASESSPDGPAVGNADAAAGDLDADTTPTRWTTPGSTVAYDIRLQARGEWTLGPAEVVVRDLLGLFERVHEIDNTDTVLVFPRVQRLTPAASRRLHATAAGTGSGRERTVFDSLREYDTGDSLRDVNWRISAKWDELIVTEYAQGSTDNRVTVAATATAAHDDEMAQAAASFAISLLDAGVSIELRLPGTTLTAEPGEQRAVLVSLARARVEEIVSATGSAAVGPPDADADVHIDATTGDVSVRLGDTHTRFDALVGESVVSPDPTLATDTGWFSNTRTLIARRRNTDSQRGQTAQ